MKVTAILGSVVNQLDGKEGRAVRYAASQLDTNANDDVFTTPEALRRRIASLEARLGDQPGQLRPALESRILALYLAVEPSHERAVELADRVPGSEPVRAALAAWHEGDSEAALELDPTIVRGWLHPTSLVAIARAWLPQMPDPAAYRTAHLLLEAAIQRSPGHREAYDVLVKLRREGEGARIASQVLALLDGSVTIRGSAD